MGKNVEQLNDIDKILFKHFRARVSEQIATDERALVKFIGDTGYSFNILNRGRSSYPFTFMFSLMTFLNWSQKDLAPDADILLYKVIESINERKQFGFSPKDLRRMVEEKCLDGQIREEVSNLLSP